MCNGDNDSRDNSDEVSAEDLPESNHFQPSDPLTLSQCRPQTALRGTTTWLCIIKKIWITRRKCKHVLVTRPAWVILLSSLCQPQKDPLSQIFCGMDGPPGVDAKKRPCSSAGYLTGLFALTFAEGLPDVR